MELLVRQELIGAHRVVRVCGDVDLATLPRLSDALFKSVDSADPTDPLLVDLDEVVVFDDAALGLLLGAAGRLRSAGRDLVVVCSVPALQRRLSITGFDRAIRVVDHVGAVAQPPLPA